MNIATINVRLYIYVTSIFVQTLETGDVGGENRFLGFLIFYNI